MKGVEVDENRVILKIANCSGDSDYVDLRILADGKRVRITHEEFTATIKVKRLEHALLLAKVIWFSRWCRDVAMRQTLIRNIDWSERRARQPGAREDEV